MVVDKYKTEVAFYRDVPEILSHLTKHPDVEAVVSASRTHAPKVAEKMLTLLHVPHEGTLVPAHDLFDHKVWGIGSKIAHFREIHKRTGVAYTDMVFFDDEMRNRDVEQQLGVTFVAINEEVGLTWSVFERGVERWKERQNKA